MVPNCVDVTLTTEGGYCQNHRHFRPGHLESGRKSHRRVREWLCSYKLERGCIDCGYRTHCAALQLDHEGEKTAEISVIRSSVRRLLAEIESGRCVVRCANCHSIKTWAEKNGHRNPTGKCFDGDDCI